MASRLSYLLVGRANRDKAVAIRGDQIEAVNIDRNPLGRDNVTIVLGDGSVIAIGSMSGEYLHVAAFDNIADPEASNG